MSTNPLPERAVSPPDQAPNPQATREGWEYATPRARRVVAEATLSDLTEALSALRFLDLTDPEDCDNFKTVIGQTREFDSYAAIERIKKLVKDYLEEKVRPWDETP
jgi:hypothetical protein